MSEGSFLAVAAAAKQFLTGAEVEKAYGFTEKNLRTMRARGLRHVRPTGHTIFYRRAWIDDYLEQLAVGGEVINGRARRSDAGVAALPRRRGRSPRVACSLLKPGRAFI
ncbi:MAG: hypothetical protein ACXVZL_07985, partial [Gaiellaceae bacterium]